ncbi:hypothetical protein GcM1_222074 [Golovinomyces cichoracearum]|uniref:Uncharacterized protein n=1 Tax=Golovinomyces cichoracearum TaxID=62708 RepID=A0A420IRH5_9PEZI|nr:hypothetical protein GcM1_222074 [Golovinomyces cichoracearum]
MIKKQKTKIADRVYQSAKKIRYEEAQLSEPNEDIGTFFEAKVEELTIDELFELDEVSITSEDYVNTFDGGADEYLFDEPMAINSQSFSWNKKEKYYEKKKRGKNIPIEADKIFSAHVLEIDNAKHPRTRHDILYDRDIEPMAQEKCESHRENIEPRRRQVEPLINARVNDGPIDYRQILDLATVKMSIKDMAQISPATHEHWKHR